MDVNVVESTIVYPSKATPNHTLWLSDIDLTKRTPYTHTPIALVYHSNHPNKNFFDTALLKATLSEILVPFYPVAGRLEKSEDNGRIEIDCNAKGVLFVEIETTQTLAEFGEFTPNAELRKLVIPTCDYFGGISSIPLLMVQFTRFQCGGVVFGSAIHHYLGDGTAYAYLFDSWSRLTRGLEFDVLPTFDRTAFMVPRSPTQVKFNHVEFQLRPSPPDEYSCDSRISEGSIVGLFKLSKDQITALKATAMSQHMDYKPSTYEVLAGHILRCVSKARSLEADQDVKLRITIDGRTRFKQLVVPQGFFGNVIFNTLCIAKAGDIVSNPLWYVASKIREAMKRVNDGNNDFARSAIDHISLQFDVMDYCTGAHTARSPNMEINTWIRIPLFDVDFGWGRPEFVRHGGIGYEGQSIIMSSANGDESLSVGINLLVDHMDLFEKYFYSFTDEIPSV